MANQMSVCEFSDLPGPYTPDAVIVARFPARFDSKCADCGHTMREGETICRTEDGDYIHEGCGL